MRKMRKLLAVTLVAAMVLGVFSVGFAASVKHTTFTDVAADHAAAADFALLNTLDIFKGYGDGTVGPNDTLTREQFATVVVRMLDRTKTADAVAKFPTNFSDDDAISSWARGSVVVASNMGIITGYPDGSFKPQGNVTFAEAYAMLARALKLDDAAVGSWPTNYIMLASDTGLDAGVDTLANMPITRSEMAIMTVNAMKSEWTWDKEEKELDKKADSSLLGSRDNVTKVENLASVTSFADNVVLVGATDINKLAGFGGWVIKNADGKATFVSVEKFGNVVTGLYKETDETNKKIVLKDGTKVDYAELTTTGKINGVSEAITLDSLALDDSVVFTLGTDGKIKSFDATRINAKSKLVDSNATAVYGSTTVVGEVYVDGTKFAITPSTSITVNGEAASFSALKGNVVIDELVVKSTSKTWSDIANNTAVLSIKATNQTYTDQYRGSYTVNLPGEKEATYLQFGTGLENTWVSKKVADPNHLDTLTPDQYGTFYLNAAGDIVHRVAAQDSKYVVRLDSSTSTKVTVNYQGEAVTYNLASGTTVNTGKLGQFAEITVNPEGKVTEFTYATDLHKNATDKVVTIQSVDSASGIVTLKIETLTGSTVTKTEYRAYNSPAAFGSTGAEVTLKAGDKVDVFEIGSKTFMLVK